MNPLQPAGGPKAESCRHATPAGIDERVDRRCQLVCSAYDGERNDALALRRVVLGREPSDQTRAFS